MTDQPDMRWKNARGILAGAQEQETHEADAWRDELPHGPAAEIKRLTNRVAADMATILQHATVPLGDTFDAAVDRLITVDAIAAQMQVDLAAVVAYARSLEDALIPTLPHDAIDPDGYVVHAGTDDEVRQDLRAEAGVQRIMEAHDGE